MKKDTRPQATIIRELRASVSGFRCSVKARDVTLAALRTERDTYRSRATKAEQESAEWKHRGGENA